MRGTSEERIETEREGREKRERSMREAGKMNEKRGERN